jgi:FtsH-binding integral membrane protein
MEPYDPPAAQVALPRPVALESIEARAGFLFKTYLHLFGALIAFVLGEVVLFTTGVAEPMANAILALPWLAILGIFMLVMWLATSMAHRVRSLPAQYGALTLGIAAEVLLFTPLLYVAFTWAPGAISSAAAVSLLGFAGLTAIALLSRRDFTFLGTFLRWIGLCALLGIGASFVFGFTLGTWFSAGMVAFAGAAILYNTSKILRHYPEERYVAASLELFTSVLLLFWYVLQLFLSRR